MVSNYVIIGSSVGSAEAFAENNMLPWTDWVYSPNLRNVNPSATIIVLNGWKKKRCLLQQGLIKAILALRKAPVKYMAETERLV